jgi:DNA-directed RNA polymerase I subunit RPA43
VRNEADMAVDGSHSLSSPSHLSLLFGKTFNVSIPLQHIPQDTYKFEHSDSPDDAPLSDDESDVEERDILDLSGPGTVEEVGRWRNTKTDKLVGDEGGKGIKFTVIG